MQTKTMRDVVAATNAALLALAASEKVELKIIDGADHFFEGEAEDEMVKFACMFMDEIENK